MKRLIILLVLIIAVAAGSIVFGQVQMERLDRGAIAVRKGQGYFISWRLLGNEPYDTGFNIYRGSAKLNDVPITSSTCFYDSVATINSLYYIKAIVDGVEKSNNISARNINTVQGNNAGYIDIQLNKPPTGSNGGTYSPNDASAGDLNGDGEYDIVLKWDPNNSKDNAHSGITDNVILDGYTLYGEQLWRIDLGPNIRAGAHYTQFLVYDFDGNGKAEIMCKTAPGTKDASGNYISKGPATGADHTKLYRNTSGRVLSGPEYITVFDGETGEELATAEYWPLRGTVSGWGDDYGNRVDRFNATVAYVDGEKPTAVFQRGYYTRQTMAAWNWRDGELSRVWTFDSNTTGNGSYYGQGNHSIHVIDANGDGLQDIVTGSAVISGTGAGMNTTGMGHGDACHVSYMQKGDNRPMIFMCHENSPYGMSLRYADSSSLLWRNTDGDDTGRGCAAELDPDMPGFKFWSVSGKGLCNIEGTRIGSYPSSVNFVIWWNGKLSRELMNSNTVQEWDIATGSSTTLLTGENTVSNNSTKSTPCLQADLFGDWREEVILRHTDNEAIRVFTTIMPTEYRLYTFMHDPTYRVAISWQQSSYNQPPHPGFYVASDMDFPPPTPDIKLLDGLYRGSGEIISDLIVRDIENSAKWYVGDSIGQRVSVYGNETLFASDLPANLIGEEWIKPSTDSKIWAEEDTLATFKVKEDAVVSVFISEQLTEKPGWLNSFEMKETTTSVSSPVCKAQTLRLYEKTFEKGQEVVLGINSSNENSDAQMYFVVVRSANETSVKTGIKAITGFKVYPTLCKTTANIQCWFDQSQAISLAMYDLNGKLVCYIDEGLKDKGLYEKSFNTSGFPEGVYLIRLVTSVYVGQQKIILKK